MDDEQGNTLEFECTLRWFNDSCMGVTWELYLDDEDDRLPQHISERLSHTEGCRIRITIVDLTDEEVGDAGL